MTVCTAFCARFCIGCATGACTDCTTCFCCCFSCCRLFCCCLFCCCFLCNCFLCCCFFCFLFFFCELILSCHCKRFDLRPPFILLFYMPLASFLHHFKRIFSFQCNDKNKHTNYEEGKSLIQYIFLVLQINHPDLMIRRYDLIDL